MGPSRKSGRPQRQSSPRRRQEDPCPRVRPMRVTSNPRSDIDFCSRLFVSFHLPPAFLVSDIFLVCAGRFQRQHAQRQVSGQEHVLCWLPESQGVGSSSKGRIAARQREFAQASGCASSPPRPLGSSCIPALGFTAWKEADRAGEVKVQRRGKCLEVATRYPAIE